MSWKGRFHSIFYLEIFLTNDNFSALSPSAQASVGASDKLQGHSVVGLTIMFFYFAMAFFGRIRYLVIEGRKVGRKMKILSLIVHRYG